MKKRILLTLSAMLLASCNDSVSSSTNDIVGRWIQNISQTGFAQENIFDYSASGIMESTETVTKYTDNNITYEGAALDTYMDSIGRTNPMTTSEYWKTEGNKLISSKSSDFSDTATAIYSISSNLLTITYGSYTYTAQRLY